jgi:hypothetical protein
VIGLFYNDIEKVRRLAGHSNISTTAKYLRDSYSDLADAICTFMVRLLLNARKAESGQIVEES